MKRNPLGRPSPLDLAFLVLGPLVFLGIAWWGVQSLLGPPPPSHAVQLLRDGRVTPGMAELEVRRLLGAPKGEIGAEDGSLTLRYQRSRWEPDTKTFTEEDAYVKLDADGRVVSVEFDSRRPTPPGAADVGSQ
jgi:hypothetical protein